MFPKNVAQWLVHTRH